MFTIPAIHHSSVKIEDGSMGTMHLNALNGSANVLGCSDTENNNNPNQRGVFGGLIGASLSENHPYRPQDCGMTFHETSKISHKKTAAASRISTSSSSSIHSKPFCDSSKSTPERTGNMAFLRRFETASSISSRRRSLDLDLVSTNTHRRYEDRSLSLDELVIGPFSRFGRFLDDAIDEQEQSSDQDVPVLSINEVSVNTPGTDQHCHVEDNEPKSKQTNKKKKKKKRSHTADASMSEKALRLLEKIKDSRRDQNIHFKQGRHANEDTFTHYDQHNDTSKIDHLRHHILHHLFLSPGNQKQEPD